jgi:ArsR family transcriptional regulator
MTAETTLRAEAETKVRREMPGEQTLSDLAEFFKVFGDVTRVRILYALLGTEMCVGDISQLLGLSQTACSHQLRVLKNNKLVRFRREGKVVYYSLSDDHVKSIIEMGLEHVCE